MLTGIWGWFLSKLRSVRQLTRSDKKAMKVLLQGCLRFDKLRFITLTGVTDFTKQFRKLKLLLKKKTQEKLEYFACLTGEGLGVAHVVYWGRSVWWKQISSEWEKISGCWSVSITAVNDVNGLIQEMCRQHKKKRYTYSKGWLPKASNQIPLDLMSS